jgi:hypothetical protein
MSESRRVCTHWHAYSRDQFPHIRRCIDENKWYLSEVAGRDVGYEVAEAHFVDNHLNRVAAEFRRDYCVTRCAGRDHCTMASLVDDLNRCWAEKEIERKAAVRPRDLTACLPVSAGSGDAEASASPGAAPAVAEQTPQPLVAEP